jgi:YD repeat-containing protein
MFKYPFSPFTGSGLGVSYSSLTQIGEILPSRGLGQGGIKAYANVATGNLVVFDHMVRAQEMNGPVQLGFVYNSLAKTPWRLAHKELKTFDPAADTIVLTEKDGHETTYTFDEVRNLYVAPGCGQGRPTFHYNQTSKQWHWHDPATGRREIYNSQGRLISFADKKGRTSTCTYDSQHRLERIRGPKGNIYEIRRSSDAVGIVMIENGCETLLQTHFLTSNGRVERTMIPDANGYEIKYTYAANTGRIFYIDQTDSTQFGFDYLPSDNEWRLTRVISGEKTGGIHVIDYEAGKTTIEDPENKQQTSISFNAKHRVTKTQRQNGDKDLDPDHPVDTRKYKYTPHGQLDTVTHPDGGQEIFQYDLLGLRCHYHGPNGQEEHFKNDQVKGDLLVHLKWFNPPDAVPRSPYQVTRQDLLPADYGALPQEYITRYIYDPNFDKLNQSNRVLRFTISPTGIVTEYRYNIWGDETSKRIYMENTYDLSKLEALEVPSLAEMETWSAQQDPSQVQLTESQHDSRGQLSCRKAYATVDGKGEGVVDGNMAQADTSYAYFGALETKVVRQSSEVTTEDDWRYDRLERLELETKGALSSIEQTTKYDYSAGSAKLIITRPNGRTEERDWNSAGNTLEETQTGQSAGDVQVRVTESWRDKMGRTIITTKPDGKRHYTFFDMQNRLVFEVNSLGALTEYVHNNTNRFTGTIRYMIPLPLDKLQPFPEILPSLADVRGLIVPSPAQDRRDDKFYDKSGRLHYEVDSGGYVIEHRHDNLDRKTAVIKYADPLTADQLEQLQQGKAISLHPDITKDRFWQYFYNAENQKVGEQDPAGYLIEYQRDIVGNVSEKITYANPTQHLSNLDKARPAPSTDDIHDYFYYDKRGQCIAHIDGEQYMTRLEHLACGKLAQKTRYANHVKADPSTTRDLSQLQPDPDSEDQVTTCKYDALYREIERDLPNLTVQATEYDKMDSKTLSGTVDQEDTSKQRRTLCRYDSWEQVAAQCDPLVAQVLADIDADPDIPPDKKQQEKEKVWKDSSLRHEYDASGLRLKSTDPEGNITRYYYDAARQPRFSIDPLGAIKEARYNTFGEVTIRRNYANFIPQVILTTLTGGFLTSETQALFDGLKDDATDAKTIIERNKLGQPIRYTDAEGYVTKNTYNAFGQCVVEEKPVAEKTPSMTVVHTKDVRGLETQTQTSSADLSLAVQHEYKSPLGKCTKTTDEIGGEHIREYDKRGNIKQTKNPLGAVHHTTHDSFDRSIAESNSLGQVTAHQYDTKKRMHRIAGQDPQGKELIHRTEQSNAFGEVEVYTDGLDNSHRVTYAPDKQVAEHEDALGRKTTEKYNLCGWHTEHHDAAGVVTTFGHDGAGNTNEQIVDTAGLALKTTIGHDAFGNKTTVTDPRGVIRTQEYDRRSLPKKGTIDPSTKDHQGIDLITQTECNDQGTKVSEVKGDANDANQRDTAFHVDSVNRDIGKTVDPTGLALTTGKHLDAAGHVIANIDGEGNINRTFYNAAGQKRFIVDAQGRITEWHYNREGQVLWQRDYAKTVDPKQLTDETTLSQLKILLTGKKDPADSVAYRFYDDLGRVRFMVTSLGAVTEKFYDDAGRESATTLYVNRVNIATLVTTAEVAAALKPDDVHDRTNYRILDAGGQERYLINPLGVVTEQRFDAMGRVITSIIYATPVADPAALAKLPLDQVDAHIPKDPVNDRATYHVFDSKGRPLFDVNPECAVIGYSHDDNDNLTKTCAFANKIKVPDDYHDLVVLLNSLQPDPQKDRITQTQYDAANREEIKTDASQNSDHYQHDALGQQRYHTDKAGAVWESRYDRGGRLVQELTPPITTTTIDSDLTETTETKPIVKKTDYDQANNQRAVTSGDGSKEPRMMTIDYNAVNKPITLAVKAPVVGDPPNIKTLFIKTVYDAKGLEVVKQDEAGYCHFLVYDTEKQLRYEVNAKGAVIGYERNAFGEPVCKTYYATYLQGIDLSQYAKTGLSISLVEQHLQPDIDDRSQEYDYDRQGNVLSVKGSEGYYYVRVQDELKFGSGRPQTRCSYNAFNEPIYTGVLIDPDTDAWSEKITWVDCTGKPLAQTDPNYYVTRLARNAFGKIVAKTEYATALTVRPTADMILAELDSKVIPDALDRHSSSEYNQLGQKTSDTAHSITVQELITNPDNTPDFHDLPAQDLTKYYQYNPTGKRIAVTHEDGSTEYTYCDARGTKIAETKVPRASGDENTLIPLTAYAVNVHGQTSKTTSYRKGTGHADGTKVPTPIDAADPANQTSRVAYDTRGLKNVTQDAEGHITNYAHTPTGQEARRWYTVTNTDGAHTDEKRTTFDELDKPVKIELLRDGEVDPHYTQALIYNTFAEQIGRGPGDGTYPEYQCYDRWGKAWLHNRSKGGDTIILTDLASRQTVTLRSAKHDLRQIKYIELPEVLNGWGQNAKDLERTERQLDLGGRMVVSRAPVYEGKDPSKPANMPLDLAVEQIATPDGPRTMLNWATLVESNLNTPQITLWPKTNKEAQTTLELSNSDGRTWANVTDLTTDIYGFQIDCFMTNPAIHEQELKYTATGEIQIATTHNEASTALVATVKDDLTTLSLTGKTAGLTAIELWQSEQQIATIPINAGQTDIDLSAYASGAYTIKPKYGEVYEEYPFDFTIFTPKPASAPLAREIECRAQVLLSETQGELIWQVPELYRNQLLFVECTCTDPSGSRYVSYQGIIEPKAGEDTYTVNFSNGAISLDHLSIGMFLDGQLIPLLDQDTSTINLIVDDKTHYEFTATTTLQITSVPGLNTTDEFTVEYLDRSMDRMQAWKILPAKTTYSEQATLIVDANQVLTGKYNYRITNITTGQKIFSGKLDVRRGTQVYMSTESSPTGDITICPIRRYEYDAWGNQTKYTNTLGHEFTKTYTHLNKPVTETTPPVPTVNEDGSKTTKPITTTNAYNLLGVEIATRDGNNHVTAVEVNAAGDTLVEILGDGTRDRSSVYDALSRVSSYADARGKVWQLGYDHLNHETSRTSPLGKQQLFSYNEAGKRSGQTNGAGETLSYDHDVAGNTRAEHQPDGSTTEMWHDLSGQLITKVSKDGVLAFERDFWGVELSSVDLSGAKYTNEYDYKKQVTRRTCTGGDHGTYLPFNPYNMHFETTPQPVPGQDVRYTYQAGLCMQTYDAAKGQTTTKEYDTERRSVSATVNYETRAGKRSKTVTQHYKYNGADQVTNDNGTAVSYQQGYRHQAGHTTYQVSDDGLLTRTDIADGSAEHYTLRQYDEANRVTHFTEKAMIKLGAYWVWLTKDTETTTHYNANGNVRYAYQKQLKDGDYNSSTTNFDTFTADGQAQHQHTNYGKVSDDLRTEFVKIFDLRMSRIHGSRSDKYGTDYATVIKYYDANGAVEAIRGASDSNKNGYFITDADGHILMKFRADWKYLWHFHIPILKYCHLSRYFYDIGGNLLGSYKADYLPTQRLYISNPASLQLYLNYFRPISKDYPPPTPGLYVVMTGDTFTAIASKTYGDTSYAGLIAEANGWTASDTPDAGAQLTIPQIIASTNAYGQARPYQEFMAIMIGNLYPHLHTPQPKKKHHHWWHKIVEIIAAVVVSILVPEIAGVLFGVLSTLETVAVDVVAGALMSAADQGVALAFHDQSKFSFKEVGVAAAEAAILPGQPSMNESWEQVMIDAATRAVEAQLFEMAVGLRSQFDFKAVLEQTAAAGLDKGLSKWEIPNAKAPNLQFAEQSFTGRAIQALSHAAITSMVYGTRFDISDAAVQYVGYVAQDIGNQINTKLHEDSEPTQQSHRQAQGASQGNRGMLDSPYRKNVISK